MSSDERSLPQNVGCKRALPDRSWNITNSGSEFPDIYQICNLALLYMRRHSGFNFKWNFFPTEGIQWLCFKSGGAVAGLEGVLDGWLEGFLECKLFRFRPWRSAAFNLSCILFAVGCCRYKYSWFLVKIFVILFGEGAF